MIKSRVPSFEIRDDKRKATCRHKWSKDCKLDKLERLARIHDALAFTLDLHMDKYDVRQPWEYWRDGMYQKPVNNPSHRYIDWFIAPCLSPEERDENRKNIAALTPDL